MNCGSGVALGKPWRWVGRNPALNPLIYIYIYLKALPQVTTDNSLKEQKQSSSRHLGTVWFQNAQALNNV